MVNASPGLVSSQFRLRRNEPKKGLPVDQAESEAALLAELVDEAKRLATRYYRATGKPLGVTRFDKP